MKITHIEKMKLLSIDINEMYSNDDDMIDLSNDYDKYYIKLDDLHEDMMEKWSRKIDQPEPSGQK